MPGDLELEGGIAETDAVLESEGATEAISGCDGDSVMLLPPIREPEYLMRPEYFYHNASFVQGIYLLSQEPISCSDYNYILYYNIPANSL